MTSAIKGFRKTGAWPLDATVFTDDDFLPAETTNISNDSQDIPTTLVSCSCDQMQSESSIQTSPMASNQIHSGGRSMPKITEIFMMPHLLQKKLRISHETASPRKRLPQRFCRYNTLTNRV
jgi:hypothetical protein